MLELRSWYRERLAMRISALEAAREGLKAKSPEALESIRRIAHSLRGSGATYGFPEITAAGRALEEASEQELPGRLEEMLSALREASARGRSDRVLILVIEDDEEQAHFERSALEGPDREILVAHTAVEAQAILGEKDVSLILLDLILPDTDGRNLLVKLRERLATAAIPVIVVTVKSAVQARDECLALGADDFLEKPVTAEGIQAAVAARLRSGSEFARELRRDPLTGLPNRAAFHEAFQRTRSGLASTQEPVSVALVDLDRFKTVNDRFGPAMGDQILRRAAAALTRSLRTSDFIARWGGEEFVVLFPKTEPAGAVVALQKALKALSQEPIPAGDGRVAEVTFSAGVAKVTESLTAEEVVGEADRCLYLAKIQGEARIVSGADGIVPPRRKILLAEDDELIRLVVKRLLEREGYEVVPFQDGASALAAALETTFSLVLSDVRMPRMDGFELLSRLREVPDFARVPIVMLTSMGSEEDVQRGYELGADDYIVKPFSSAELLARIRRLMKRA